MGRRARASGLFFEVAQWHGAPIRFHFSALVTGGLVFWLWSLGAVLALLLLILAHEIGHAVLARRRGLHVVSIDIVGHGGECRITEWPTEWDQAVCAWGGVLGQFVMLWVPDLLRLAGLVGSGPVSRNMLTFLIGPNIGLMALNLLPFGRLDGATAWRIVPLAFGRWRARLARKRVVRGTARDEPPRILN